MRRKKFCNLKSGRDAVLGNITAALINHGRDKFIKMVKILLSKYNIIGVTKRSDWKTILKKCVKLYQ